MKKEPRKPITVLIPEGLLKKVDKLAEIQERSRSYLIRKALEEYLGRFHLFLRDEGAEFPSEGKNSRG